MPCATELGRLLADARALVAFTGAGVSTESGIPDFRSPTGLWTRHDPRELTFSRYVASGRTRARAWRMRRAFWAADPRPNAAHGALARLEAAGRVRAVVTQNIDGLHQAAGSRTVVELHGTVRQLMCSGSRPRAGTPAGCGFRAGYRWAMDRVDTGDPDPRCPECEGLVKSAAVGFGQNLFPGAGHVLPPAVDLALHRRVPEPTGSGPAA